MPKIAPALVLCLALGACSAPESTPAADTAPGPTPTIQRTPLGELPDIDADAVLAHTKILASDEYGGRGPGTKGEELTVNYLVEQFKKIGLKPGNTDGTYVQKVPLVGITADGAPLDRPERGRSRAPASMGERSRGVDQARRRQRGHRQFRDGLRRLRRRRAGVRLGRLQGPRRQGQDAGDADQRSAGARSREWLAARSQNVRRSGDDLLRAVDVQVRDRRRERRRGRADHPRDRAGRLPLRSAAGRQPRREARSGDARQEHGTRRHRRLGHGRSGPAYLDDGRSGFRRAEAAGGDARVPARAARPDCVDPPPKQAAHHGFAERPREGRGPRSPAPQRVRDLHRALGPPGRRSGGGRRPHLQRRGR